MKVGMSLLAESSDGVSEIPSTQEQQPEEVQVAIPVIVEPLISDENISLEDLTELRNSIEKAQGVNKDFVLSMEAIAPGITKEAGLHINGFTECLSKVNYDETIQAINQKLGYSEEGFKEIVNKIKRKIGLKEKTKNDYLASFNLLNQVFGSDFQTKFIEISKRADSIVNLLKVQSLISEEICRSTSELYILDVDEMAYDYKKYIKIFQDLENKFEKENDKIEKNCEKVFGLNLDILENLSKSRNESKDYSIFDRITMSEELLKAVNIFIKLPAKMGFKEVGDINLLFTEAYNEFIFPWIREETAGGLDNAAGDLADIINKSTSEICFNSLYNFISCSMALIYRE